MVSVLGLGTVKLGRREGVKYPDAFDLPTDERARHLLSTAKTLGINLIDTAPAYGTSERRLGELLDGRWDDWVIVTKAGETFEDGRSSFDFTPHAIRESVERSLDRLKATRLGAVLLHSDGNDLEIINESGAVEMLVELRDAGVIGAPGVSTKTRAGGLRAVERLAELGGGVAMVTHNLAYDGELEVIERAAEKGVGVLVKKGLQSGHAGNVADSIRHVIGTNGVTSLIVGTINTEHLKENALAADPPEITS